MAVNGIRSAVITIAIENAKDMVKKVENPFNEVWLSNLFFCKHMKQWHELFGLYSREKMTDKTFWPVLIFVGLVE